uniref:Uncharacterized protein n=1 Tax=Romanomermis culicivorax TaxID=13658 RepID=A0A915JMS8_ROMCU
MKIKQKKQEGEEPSGMGKIRSGWGEKVSIRQKMSKSLAVINAPPAFSNFISNFKRKTNKP